MLITLRGALSLKHALSLETDVKLYNSCTQQVGERQAGNGHPKKVMELLT